MRGLLLSEGKRVEGKRERKSKGGERGDGVEARISFTKMWAWRPHARPLAGFKGARSVQGHNGDAKCVTEILGDKNKEVWGQSLNLVN